MSLLRFDIISIGTLSRNRLWNETQATRTAHATTTLIRAGKQTILVDPGLPPQALSARLYERTGLKPDAVDTVFLTNFRPAHRGGLSLFSAARILIHEQEKQAIGQHLSALQDQADPEDEARKIISSELALLERCQPAPDQLAEQISLFPLFGYTPGNCGLIMSLPTTTVLLAGDAVATQDHFLAGQVLPDAFNLSAAREAFAEVYEIADLIIPGHDNLFQNPRTFGL